jgi:hypothetical protein
MMPAALSNDRSRPRANPDCAHLRHARWLASFPIADAVRLIAAARLELIPGGDVPGGQEGQRADRMQPPRRQRVLLPDAGAKASPR